MLTNMLRFPIVLMLFFLVACNASRPENSQPVARVLDRYLLTSEVEAFIPAGTPRQDSLMLAKNYIRGWVNKELMLDKARQNLTDAEKDIRQLVEDYAASILIHRYKEKMIASRLATDVRDADIEKYYNEHLANFVLTHDVVRALLVILPKETPNLEMFRQWILSDDPDDQVALEEYCITNAKKRDNFGNRWVELRYLIGMLPVSHLQWEEEHKGKSFVEVEDDGQYYFLKITDIRHDGETVPPDYVEQEIETILRNKQKLDFEENLERQINEEGVRKGYVTIYE